MFRKGLGNLHLPISSYYKEIPWTWLLDEIGVNSKIANKMKKQSDESESPSKKNTLPEIQKGF